jgi:hypothetical protein
MVIRIPPAQLGEAATSLRGTAGQLRAQQSTLRAVHGSLDVQARAWANIDGLAWEVDVTSYRLADDAEALALVLDRVVDEFTNLDELGAAQLTKLADAFADLQREWMKSPTGAMRELLGKHWQEFLGVGLLLFVGVAGGKKEVKHRDRLGFAKGFGKAAWGQAKGIGQVGKGAWDSGLIEEGIKFNLVMASVLMPGGRATPRERLEFAKGVGERAWGTATGVGQVAKWYYWDSAYYADFVMMNPALTPLRPLADWQTRKYADEIREHRRVDAQIARYIVENPGASWDMFKEEFTRDIVDAWNRGDEHEAAGMVTWDVASLFFGTKGVTSLSKIGKVAGVGSEVADASALGRVAGEGSSVGGSLSRAASGADEVANLNRPLPNAPTVRSRIDDLMSRPQLGDIGSVPARVQSRINVRIGNASIKGSGLEYALKGHGGFGPASKSQFTIARAEIEMILRDPRVVRVQARPSGPSGNFVREVDVADITGGSPIGRMPVAAGGQATTVISVLTDRYGNLVNIFPGTLARSATLG